MFGGYNEPFFQSQFLHANVILANLMILTCLVKFFLYSQTSHQVSSVEVDFKGFYRPVNIANQCAKFRVHANFFGVSLHFFNLVGIELSINACKQVILAIFGKFGGKMARLMFIPHYIYNFTIHSSLEMLTMRILYLKHKHVPLQAFSSYIVDGRAGIAYVLLHTVVNFFIIDLCQKKSATWILCIFFYPIFPMLQKICYMDSMYLLPFYAIQICYMDFMYLIPSYLFYATSHYISLILSVLSHYMNM